MAAEADTSTFPWKPFLLEQWPLQHRAGADRSTWTNCHSSAGQLLSFETQQIKENLRSRWNLTIESDWRPKGIKSMKIFLFTSCSNIEVMCSLQNCKYFVAREKDQIHLNSLPWTFQFNLVMEPATHRNVKLNYNCFQNLHMINCEHLQSNCSVYTDSQN